MIVGSRKDPALFDALEFVTKALGDDLTREALTYVHVEDRPGSRVLTGSDGRRLYRVSVDADACEALVPPGLYNVDRVRGGKFANSYIVELVENPPQYPDLDKVVRLAGELPKESAQVHLEGVKQKDGRFSAEFCRIAVMVAPNTIKIEYVADLIGRDWLAGCPNGPKTARFESGDYLALIATMSK